MSGSISFIGNNVFLSARLSVALRLVPEQFESLPTSLIISVNRR